MQDNIFAFEAGTPFSEAFQLLHNDRTTDWYQRIRILSEMTGLPMQTVMESWEDLTEYLRGYQP